MKTFMFCLLLLSFATMGITTPVRAQKEDVFSFITDALESTRTNEKAMPANITGYRNPPSKSVTKDSEDTSEEWSSESFAMHEQTEPEVSDNGGRSRDTVKDLDSDEMMIPLVLEKDKTPLRKTGADMKRLGLMDTSERLLQDHGSREQSGSQGPHQASREGTDFHSEEEMTVTARLPEKQVMYLREDKATGSTSQGASLQRQVGRVDVLNGMLAENESREGDGDSLEDNNGRPYLVGNSRDKDYDETREYISSETYPQGQMPYSSYVPAKSPAS